MFEVYLQYYESGINNGQDLASIPYKETMILISLCFLFVAPFSCKHVIAISATIMAKKNHVMALSQSPNYVSCDLWPKSQNLLLTTLSTN